jgi:hypothetical protein
VKRYLISFLCVIAAATTLFGQNLTTVVNNGPPADKLDIVLVPSHYYGAKVGSNLQWRMDAAVFQKQLMQHDFFNRFRDRVNIHRLDISTANDFAISAPSSWVPDMTRIKAFAKAEAPFLDYSQNDQIIFIVEATQLRADPRFNPKIDVTRGNPTFLSIESTSVDPLVHEFGHSFGGLGDEYPKESDTIWVSTYVNIATVHAGNQCDDLWGELKGIVILTPGTWVAPERHLRTVGCYESQKPTSPGRRYRSTEKACIMDQIDDKFPFCPVCQRRLVKLMDRYKTSRVCSLGAGTYRNRADFERTTGSLQLVDFDQKPDGTAISAGSPGILLKDQYASVGVEFTSGVIFGEPNLPFTGVSKPNTVSNSSVNLPERSLVAGYFPSPVCAVGITNTGAVAILRLYDEGYRLVDSISSDANSATTDFIGIIASRPVHRIELDFESGIGFGGDDLLFGVPPTS